MPHGAAGLALPSNAGVFAVGEMPEIQALRRAAPLLPMIQFS